MLTKTFSGESREFTGGKLMDAIHTFAGASVVVGSHGSALLNIFFAPEDACIIEQQPRSVYMHSSNREIFHRIATQSGQTYIRVLRDDEGYDFHIAYLERAVKRCQQGNAESQQTKSIQIPSKHVISAKIQHHHIPNITNQQSMVTKYDIDKTAIGSMVAHAANYTREMQLSSSLEDFWKWVYRTDQDEQVVYVKIEDLDHLKIPSAQLLGPFMFLSRKRGYRFAGCSRNGTVAAFSRESVLKSWFGKSEFDESNCFHTVGGLEKARALDFNFHHITGASSDQDGIDLESHVTKKCLYAVITLPSYSTVTNSGVQRMKNIKKIRTMIPSSVQFNASYNLDDSCLEVLNIMRIRISANYYSDERGKGWIHGGKVGIWCSFLRFLRLCNQSSFDFCVWMEDDLILNSNTKKEIQNHLKESNFPVISLGDGNVLNILIKKNLPRLLTALTNREIQYPLDITLRSGNWVRVDRKFDGRKFQKKDDSSIVCSNCKLYSYSYVNKKIQTYSLF